MVDYQTLKMFIMSTSLVVKGWRPPIYKDAAFAVQVLHK